MKGKPKKQYIKGSQLFHFSTVCTNIRQGYGVFIGDKYYSAEFLVNWKISTLIKYFNHTPFYTYYKRKS